jgi:hypothetical protein
MNEKIVQNLMIKELGFIMELGKTSLHEEIFRRANK